MINLPLGKTADQPLQVKAGEVIFGQGEASKYLCLLKKGSVLLLKETDEHLLGIKLCREKEILNEVSVLTNKPTEFAAFAKSDVEIILVEQKDILNEI